VDDMLEFRRRVRIASPARLNEGVDRVRISTWLITEPQRYQTYRERNRSLPSLARGVAPFEYTC